MNNTNTIWNSIWSVRGNEFNEAMFIAPSAREMEISPLLNGLKTKCGMSFLEIGPCGGSLLRAVRNSLNDNVKIYAIEPAEIHVKSLPKDVQIVTNSDITKFNLKDSSIHRVGNLAALHHTKKTQQIDFFTESYRVLKKNGVLGIADVMLDTCVAEWLNVFVNNYNSYGHKGYFLEKGELKRNLELVGFDNVIENYLEYYWIFSSVGQMIKYCKSMFHLDLAEDNIILQGIEDILSYRVNERDEVLMSWGLVYGFGDYITNTNTRS